MDNGDVNAADKNKEEMFALMWCSLYAGILRSQCLLCRDAARVVYARNLLFLIFCECICENRLDDRCCWRISASARITFEP